MLTYRDRNITSKSAPSATCQDERLAIQATITSPSALHTLVKSGSIESAQRGRLTTTMADAWAAGARYAPTCARSASTTISTPSGIQLRPIASASLLDIGFASRYRLRFSTTWVGFASDAPGSASLLDVASRSAARESPWARSANRTTRRRSRRSCSRSAEPHEKHAADPKRTGTYLPGPTAGTIAQ